MAIVPVVEYITPTLIGFSPKSSSPVLEEPPEQAASTPVPTAKELYLRNLRRLRPFNKVD